jgi:hypothetical protein
MAAVPSRRDRWVSAVWVGIGLAWIALCVYGWGSWVLSPQHFQPVPLGPDVLSPRSLFWIRVIEGGSVLVTVWMAWHYWVQPWRAQRRLSLEGKVLIGGLFGVFWDPVINYFHWTFAWNTHAFNRGDWAPWIPGHQLGHAFAEGLLWATPQYLYLGLVTAILMLRGTDVMARRGMGFRSAMCLMFLAAFVADIVWETAFIHAELYAYPRGLSWFTLWAGSRWQLPLNEALFVALYPVSIVLLLKSAREGHASFLERGLADYPPRWRGGLGLVAIIGFCGLRPGVAYFIPWALVSLVADSVVTDLPTYLMYAP